MDAEGADVGMVKELRCAKKEREEMVIIETPDAVGAGGFEVVGALNLAHQVYVPRKDEEGEGGKCGGWKEVEAIQAEKPDYEVQFVAGTVVDASAVAEGVVEVG